MISGGCRTITRSGGNPVRREQWRAAEPFLLVVAHGVRQRVDTPMHTPVDTPMHTPMHTGINPYARRPTSLCTPAYTLCAPVQPYTHRYAHRLTPLCTPAYTPKHTGASYAHAPMHTPLCTPGAHLMHALCTQCTLENTLRHTPYALRIRYAHTPTHPYAHTLCTPLRTRAVRACTHPAPGGTIRMNQFPPPLETVASYLTPPPFSFPSSAW